MLSVMSLMSLVHERWKERIDDGDTDDGDAGDDNDEDTDDDNDDETI